MKDEEVAFNKYNIEHYQKKKYNIERHMNMFDRKIHDIEPLSVQIHTSERDTGPTKWQESHMQIVFK